MRMHNLNPDLETGSDRLHQLKLVGIARPSITCYTYLSQLFDCVFVPFLNWSERPDTFVIDLFFQSPHSAASDWTPHKLCEQCPLTRRKSRNLFLGLLNNGVLLRKLIVLERS